MPFFFILKSLSNKQQLFFYFIGTEKDFPYPYILLLPFPVSPKHLFGIDSVQETKQTAQVVGVMWTCL